ncbi:MAG: YkgJ family cysteine cluster protein [Roseivirga sp.]|nr:YkgJ family cysteine cluster protein [Roseivirga sp.]
MTDNSSSSLCTQCGVCCDGSFFELAGVRPSDLNDATRKLDMVKTGDKLQINLPCSAHINNRCTIYDQRPWVCRAYECKLLKEHKRGEVNKDEALSTINNLKSALEEINALLESAGVPKANHGIHKRMRVLEQESLSKVSLPEYRKTHGPLIIKHRLLQKLLAERFGIIFQKKNRA